jgi:hypothetical protein
MERKWIVLHVLNTACPCTRSSKTSPVRGGRSHVTCPGSWTHAHTHTSVFVTFWTRSVTMATRIQNCACNSGISNSHPLQCWNKANYLGWRQERSNQSLKEPTVTPSWPSLEAESSTEIFILFYETARDHIREGLHYYHLPCPEDECSRFLRNVITYVPHHTASHPRSL